ncbi:MAG: hypothetical protein QG608_1974 [Actinomycetota bacterium]|nr:hypothetical protein [Actinomycetota bacterium]
MILTLSAVILLGVLVTFLVRYAGLLWWHALICILFGFLLAASSLAPYIRSFVAVIARVLAGLHL